MGATRVNPSVKTTENGSQSDRALINLRDILLRGEFRAGERISELPLVARLGVSRTPVRLALERLAQEGLLKAAPNGGFTVREFTLGDIWDAIEARGALEGAAAKLGAERWEDPQELQRLRTYTNEMGALPEPTTNSFLRYSELNAAFHASLMALAKSPILEWALERFQSIPFAAPSAIVLPAAREIVITALEHHHAIVDAIQNREGSLAENCAREHARLARRNLEIALQDKNILCRVPGASLIKIGSASAMMA